MLPNRISAKLFFNETAALDVAPFISLFHRWIREARVPGVPIDVVNYSHVHNGPSLLLVGHASDHIVDFGHGRPGLRYVHKRDWPGDTLASRLQTTLEGLLLGARLITEPVHHDSIVGAPREAPQPAVTFNTGELELTFPDRLHTPNTADTFAAIEHEVRAALSAFYGDGAFTLARAVKDERRALAITVQSQHSPTLDDLTKRLSPATVYA